MGFTPEILEGCCTGDFARIPRKYTYVGQNPVGRVDPNGLQPTAETYQDIYSRASSLRAQAMSGRISGLDAAFATLDLIAAASHSSGEFDELVRSIFVPNSSLNWKQELFCPRSSLQKDDDPWLSFPTTGWGKGWKDLPQARAGNPDYDQMHHFAVFMHVGMMQASGTGHNLVRRVDSPVGPNPNWADIWLGDAGVAFGGELRDMMWKRTFSQGNLKAMIARLKKKLRAEPSCPKR